jgi:hypothetical protein
METWALRMCLLEMELARRITTLLKAGSYHMMPRCWCICSAKEMCGVSWLFQCSRFVGQGVAHGGSQYCKLMPRRTHAILGKQFGRRAAVISIIPLTD